MKTWRFPTSRYKSLSEDNFGNVLNAFILRFILSLFCFCKLPKQKKML